ncbi:murein biosynthesis integral membrane protein MurJ [Jatrophihabitans sp. YIM 134969]
MTDDWSSPTLHGATTPVDDHAGGVDTVAPDEPSPPAEPETALDAGYAALATGIGPTVGADPVAAGTGTGMGDHGGWSAAVLYEAGGSDTWSHVTYAGSRRHRPHDDATTPPATEPATPEPAAPDADADGPADTVAPAAGAAPAAESNRGILSSSRTMAIASLTSRVTGLLRTVAIAAVLGSIAGNISDPYNSANALPNMVYELLVGGVLSSVLIPLIVFAQEHDRDRGEAYTQRLLSIATAALGVATMLAVLAAPLITAVVVGEQAKRPLTTIFATLLLPEIFFYGISALFVAVLNSRGVFGPGAWAPVWNNVVVLATVAVFLVMPGDTPTIAGITTAQILVLGIGTTLGIVVQALAVVPALRRSGFRWRWRFRATSAEENGRLREVRTLGLWVLGYVAASQVGVVVIQRVGTSQGDTGYSTFVYADLLFQVPYGIVGVSLLTALMPRMSRAAANGDLRAVVDDLGLGARLSAVALVPITFGLIVLGPSLTTAILVGKFEPSAASLVGVVLAMSAFGLLPFAIVMLQLRVFYAMRDARTPTLINVGMVASKVVVVLLAVTLFDSDRHVIEALGVGTSLSYVVGMVIGHVLLQRRLGTLGFRAVGVTVLRIALASAVGAAVALLAVLGANALFDGPRVTAVTGLLAGAVLGGAVMVAVAWVTRIPEIRDLAAVVRPGSTRNTGTPAAVEQADSEAQVLPRPED